MKRHLGLVLVWRAGQAPFSCCPAYDLKWATHRRVQSMPCDGSRAPAQVDMLERWEDGAMHP
jgi:hypothetical protein